MNEILRILVFIMSISLLTACDSENNNGNKISETEKAISAPPKPCEEYSSPLNIVNENDTLKIVVQRSDCGEWGGNKEYIYLQRNDRNSNKICARFILDSISCDQIIEKNGYGVLDDRLRQKIVDTSKILNINEEILISKMLQRILELYLKNEVHANAGSYFQISNSDGTMNISYWNSGDCRDTYYYTTRKQIFGDYKLK